MEYQKQDLGSCYLHYIKTNKFKTVTVRISFKAPIKKEDTTYRNFLCNIMNQSSENYKNKRELVIKTQDLYACNISSGNQRFGNYINTDFYLSVLNDRYTEEGNMEEALQFFFNIIFKPDVENKKFRKEKFEITKHQLQSELDSLKENPNDYSLIRMLENMGEDSPISYRSCGYQEVLDTITEENLYKYYQDMIKTNLVDIFVIGDIDFVSFKEMIRRLLPLRTFKKRREDYILENRRTRKSPLLKKEDTENLQSKLVYGCFIENLEEEERKYALTLYNVILGGGTESKLFREVREKNSLCYVISSVVNKFDDLLIIRAGIDDENLKKATSLIEEEMTKMKRGKFTLEDINSAKEYYLTVLDEVEDSPNRIIDNYLMMEILGTDTLEEKREKILQVTKEEIVRVAKKVKIDTIFCLRGKGKEE